MKQIRIQIEEATSDYDREKLQERVAKLAGGVAVIKVGAATEVEMKEKKARVEDALHATPRCGGRRHPSPVVAWPCCAPSNPLAPSRVTTPTRTLASSWCSRPSKPRCAKSWANAGGEPSVVINKVLEGKGNFGFNAANDTYGDMIEMGILDPTKVTRTALQNAASVASLMLTTECMVAESPKDDAPAGGMGGMGGMGHVIVPCQRRHAGVTTACRGIATVYSHAPWPGRIMLHLNAPLHSDTPPKTPRVASRVFFIVFRNEPAIECPKYR